MMQARCMGAPFTFDEDLAHITTLENNGAVVPPSDYHTLPRNGPAPYYGLLLLTHAPPFTHTANGPQDAIAVTGKWAYSLTPPADIVHAARRLAGFYFREKDAQVFDAIGPQGQGQITLPPSEPAAIKAILSTYIKPASILQ